MKPLERSIILALLLFSFGVEVNAQKAMDKSQKLSKKESSIVAVSAFTANGDQNKLRGSLNVALDVGLTVSEIKEVLVQLYAYAGFPRSLNALNTFMAVLNERKSKDIHDPLGKAPSAFPKGKTKLEFGEEMQTKLVGRPVTGEVYKFAPVIDSFLKEHLFGDIFGRDNLDWKTRELATVSALAALGGVEPQLRSHFNVAMRNGLTKDELGEVVDIIQSTVDENKGLAAKEVLKAVLNEARNTNGRGDEDHNVCDTIFGKGDKASPDNFTGAAWVNRLVKQDESGPYSVGNVLFELGARTNWHLHPGGQILIVLEGTGWYQEKGKPARVLKKGDVVIIPANVEHWHGASSGSSLTHIAITNSQGGGVKWLNAVTEAEYNSIQ